MTHADERGAGKVTTSFIEQRPELLTQRSSADRGTRILRYLADVTVNKPHGERPSAVYPQQKLPAIDMSEPPPAGSRQRRLALGPERAKSLRDQRALVLRARVRVRDVVAARVAPGGRARAGGHHGSGQPPAWRSEMFSRSRAVTCWPSSQRRTKPPSVRP